MKNKDCLQDYLRQVEFTKKYKERCKILKRNVIVLASFVCVLMLGFSIYSYQVNAEINDMLNRVDVLNKTINDMTIEVNSKELNIQIIDKPLVEEEIVVAKQEVIEVIPKLDTSASRSLVSKRKNYKVPTYNDILSFDLLIPTGATKEELEMILTGTGFEGMGKYFYDAEQSNGVNAIFLISVGALESGWNRSTIAKTKNNIFGWRAYDNSTHLAREFADVGECVLYVSNIIKRDYLTESGNCYYGSNLYGVNTRYSTTQEWKNVVGEIMVQMYNKLGNIRKENI